MKAAIIILVACAVTVISALAIRAILERHAVRQVTSESSYQPARSTSAARVQQPRTLPVTPQPASTRVSNPIAAGKVVPHPASISNATSQINASNSSTARTVPEPLQDPLARVALIFVGADPDAEAYWYDAINDLSLPANERQDLIEDLNEEGLPDPKHPTVDDLPLILNRLALIETIGADAADQVNADAFMEAYKDLLNMAELAMGGGKPVN